MDERRRKGGGRGRRPLECKRPLNDEERAQVMRAAVAYSLGNDQTALDHLREHYAAKMNASPDARRSAS